jgi:trimeric autotransporter adhesin
MSGLGAADIQLQWNQLLEGSSFSTFANPDIGIVVNQPPNWALPVGTGDNSLNTATANFTTFGAFGVGAKPPAFAFTFNPIPPKTYGNPDFNGGAISSNTSQPIIYTSSNPAVATIVANNIHITGTGTTDITASQASDGFYPAVSVTQTLTVNKAPLTVKADDKTKPEGDPNPTLTVTYTGFVYGETSAVLLTQPTISTTAVTASPAGTYPITVSGATAANYTITFVSGTMTVTPRTAQTITFNALPTKTYGNADFAAGATSTNNTITITYSSSNTAVATIAGSNIHIVGAGTSTITASQAGSPLFFPAPNVSRTLTVNKANLTVRAADTTKMFGDPNPVFRLIYTGFVLGENAGALATLPAASTFATTTSPPGYYAIDVSGGVAANYNFIYTSGRLTIFPATGTGESFIQVFQTSANVLRVKIFSPGPDLADFVIFDMTGKPLLKKNVFLPQGFINTDLDVTLLPAGNYVINVVGKNSKLKKKFSLIH